MAIVKPSSSQKPQDTYSRSNRDFSVLKVRGFKVKQVQDVIHVDKYQKISFSRMNNEQLFKILEGEDDFQKRELSKWYAIKNGMYQRAVRYISDIYKFDFMLYPNIDLDDELPEEKQKSICKKFNVVLEHFDNSAIQLFCRKCSQIICTQGAYYG